MEDYNLRLDKEVFPKWKAELKEKEESPLLDTNGEPIFTCDGIMWKNNVSKEELYSHPLRTIFQHKACTDKLYADSFYKVQKNSHSSFEVICCRS